MTPEKVKYLYNLSPILDKEGKFVFIGNHKCAQISITRFLLKDRVLVYKDNEDVYDKAFGRYDFANTFIFTIVRNPFARVVSAFEYLKRLQVFPAHMLFDTFIIRHNPIEYDIHFHTMVDRVFMKGKNTPLVNEIIWLEQIDRQWRRVAERIDAPDCVPHENKTKHGSYLNYYENDYVFNKVSQLYSMDLAVFGYTFGGK